MKNTRMAAVICGGMCACLLAYYCLCKTGTVPSPARAFEMWSGGIAIDPTKLYKVTYVIDGDTFKTDISGHIITVRVLGMNTPETVDPYKPIECYGPEASAEGKSLLDGRSVTLKFNPNREQKDKYGRYLLYVYRDDGLFYNEYMIQKGFAEEYTVGTPYSFQSEFKNDQAVAQAAKIGLWGKCPQPFVK